MRKFTCTLVLTICLFSCVGCEWVENVVKNVLSDVNVFDVSACVEKQDGTITCWEFPVEQGIMNCSRCGGTMVPDGEDAYYTFFRCTACGRVISVPKLQVVIYV